LKKGKGESSARQVQKLPSFANSKNMGTNQPHTDIIYGTIPASCFWVRGWVEGSGYWFGQALLSAQTSRSNHLSRADAGQLGQHFSHHVILNHASYRTGSSFP
jgi:hypothetical protein